MRHLLVSGRRLFVLTLLALAVACCNAGTCDGSDEDLLMLLEAGSANAVKAVRSGEGRVTVVSQVFSTDVVVQESETTYNLVFSGENHHASAVTTLTRIAALPGLDQQLPAVGTRTEVLLQVLDGKATVLSQQRQGVARISWAGGSLPIDDDVRNYLRSVGHKGNTIPSHGLLAISIFPFGVDADVIHKSKAVVGEELVDGDLCKIVELTELHSKSDTTLTYRIWVDPSKGFTIPRLRVIGSGGRYRAPTTVIEENVELREYCPDVWYPAKAVEETWRVDSDGQRVRSSVTTVTWDPGFRLNAPVMADELALELPSGTRTRDDILDADYTVP